MRPIRQEDIHLIGRHSDMSEQEIHHALQTHVYPAARAWKKFIHRLLLVLGVGFTACGIVFFFAYNWQDLHKFVKLGLIECLLLVSAGVTLYPPLSHLVRSVLLTGASVLVGVLFAVFGQIYQTGANAYDFFCGWWLLISVWVWVSDFAPLWLLYIVLANVTLNLYEEQVASGWSTVFLFTLHFALNGLPTLGAALLSGFKVRHNIPHWLLHITGLAAVTSATFGIVVGIFGHGNGDLVLLLLLAMPVYVWAFVHDRKRHQLFYLAVIPFSLMVIASALLLKLSNDAGMLFMVSLFIVVGVTLLIKSLIDTQKKWNDAN